MNKSNIDLIIKALQEEKEIKTMEIETGLNVFLEYIKLNKSKGTYTHYLCYCKQFKKYCDYYKIYNTNQITTKEIELLKERKKIKGNKNSTINKFLILIGYFLKILVKKGFIDYPEDLIIEKLKADDERFKIIPKQDMNRLIEYTEFMHPNSRLLIFLLISTGARREEIVNIKNKNINFSDNSIYLEHTKNGKNRYVFVDDRTIEEIKKHQINTEYLLYDKSKTSHINADACNSLCEHIKKVLGFENLAPHMFRHTFATSLLNNRVDLETIRLLLGHSDYSMLKRYIHIENTKLSKAALLSNPLIHQSE